ncbi:IclR family transcriptional regulator [Acinetobacter sp. KS-LM10]|uniref:IclR family transcriptional regulator n=1 Tax=Acinetobacter sp. KS-LM10 TaxID=3120518 RepID=UPI0030CCC17C
MTKLHNFSKLLGLFKTRTFIDVETVKKELGLSTASAYRYLSDFESIGLLEKKTPSNYVLGSLIIELDRNIRENDPLIKSAENLMMEISNLYKDSVVVLSRLYGEDKVLCVHQVKGGDCDFNISYERGKTMDIFKGATSKSILAWLNDDKIWEIYNKHSMEILKITEHKSYDSFYKYLREIRKNKVCITYSELDIGVYGIASPIFFKNKLMGSFSIVVPEKSIDNLKKISDKIHRTSLQISGKIENLNF